MLDLLLERGSLTVGELAAEFPDLVPSGISKHLMNLRAAGLVVAQKEGRHQRYRIDQDGLTAAFSPWVARYEALWTQRPACDSEISPRSARNPNSVMNHLREQPSRGRTGAGGR